MNEINKRLEDIFWYLMDEYSDLIINKKRPPKSALNQILDKTSSIMVRANSIVGGTCFNGSENFVILYCVQYNKNIDKLKQYFKSESQFKDACAAIEQSKEYNKVVQDQKEHDKIEEELKRFTPYRVTPFEELIKNPNKISSEILYSLEAIGQYHRIGFTIDMIRPLIERTQFLRLVSQIYNKLTPELVEEFEADHMACINRLSNIH